jgi:hypothetical protein
MSSIGDIQPNRWIEVAPGELVRLLGAEVIDVT